MIERKAITLAQALEQIADYTRLPVADLQRYAVEDTIGGWDHHKSIWPVGSLFGVEGQVLYALTRALQPQAVYEIGIHYGCSTSHLLSALIANGDGQLIAADFHGNGGTMIKKELRGPLTIFREDGPEVLGSAGKAIKWPDGKRRKLPAPDLVFEDGSHGRGDVARAVKAARELLNPGGLLVVHDALHFLVKEAVQGGIEDAGLTGVLYVLIEPSDCGIAIWQKETPE